MEACIESKELQNNKDRRKDILKDDSYKTVEDFIKASVVVVH